MFKQIHFLIIALSMTILPCLLEAQSTTTIGPAGSGSFGNTVLVLSNGNYVVADPLYDNGGVVDAGAVYLYNGLNHTLISTVKGSSTNDNVGSSIYYLSNGNFIIRSPNWDNGAATDAGAATWVNGVTGLNGVVSQTNSLVGTTSNDKVGQFNILALPNGNYVVFSPVWDNGAFVDAGAVTWGNGTTGIAGVISPTNSLVGSASTDNVGSIGATIVGNSNYVVRSDGWDNGAILDAGAATWCNGATGLSGVISASNSLVGAKNSDWLSSTGVVKLANGNYFVRSNSADNGAFVDAGAITWGDGNIGVKGTIGIANSLMGGKNSDFVGSGNFSLLSNGNFVVTSTNWDNGAIVDAGAATWISGTTGLTGLITSGNSLVGTTTSDRVGSSIVTLTNGNYVVLSSSWNIGALVDIGAVTWGSGTTGVVGNVSNINSVVGSIASDLIGTGGVTPLTNGNYVINSWSADNGAKVDAGAVTWCNGATGTSGTVSISNSLMGGTANDQVGRNGIAALTNGNYVVSSRFWDNGAVVDAGAATWGNGASGISGLVSTTNSLVGVKANDQVAYNAATPLTNGNYVVKSYLWDNGATTDVGAITWGNGTTGITGNVSTTNSFVGSSTFDVLGNQGVMALENGNFIVRSADWDNGAISDAGAVTWGNGATGLIGTCSASNSLVGGTANDRVCNFGTFALKNGNYIVSSGQWDNGSVVDAGAVTWCNGVAGTTGLVSSSNSLVGGIMNDKLGSGSFQTIVDGNYIFTSTSFDNASLTDAKAATWGNGSSGVTGTINTCNSVLGGVANGNLNIVYHDSFKYMIVGRPNENLVTVYNPTGMQLANTKDSATTSIVGSTAVQFVTSTTCKILGAFSANGSSPVSGKVDAKVWFESSIPTFGGAPYVARHHQILPATNASSSTGKITLFYTQQEFNDFNSDPGSTLDLPTGPANAAGIANLRIGRFDGNSSDGSGLPASYAGAITLIDPTDADIVWNNALSRWEVTFSTTGFGGFILKTGAGPVSIASNNTKGIEVFPNPSNDGLFNVLLSNNDGKLTSVQLTDLQGRNINTLNLEGNGNHSIDISNQEAGIYLMKMENGIVYKLIKN